MVSVPRVLGWLRSLPQGMALTIYVKTSPLSTSRAPNRVLRHLIFCSGHTDSTSLVHPGQFCRAKAIVRRMAITGLGCEVARYGAPWSSACHSSRQRSYIPWWTTARGHSSVLRVRIDTVDLPSGTYMSQYDHCQADADSVP